MTEAEMNATGASAIKRIMLVDDDSSLLAGLTRALESQGYIVRAVDHPIKAFESAATFSPDLIVLDVMMPHMDGWEVLGQLRAHATTERVPVIMLTAADSDQAKAKGFELGADDYLTKPFSVQELRYRVAAVLRRTSVTAPDESSAYSIPVFAGGSELEFVRCKDVYYIEGVRNYTYVHSANARFLSRMTLGALEQEHIDGLMRVHRSFIVNLSHVRGCGWTNRSAYRLRMANAEETAIPVSRTLVAEIQKRLGVRT